MGEAQPHSSPLPGLELGAAWDAGWVALTCHGHGFPASIAALPGAQPPLLAGAVQFRTWHEGTFHLPILEENQEAQTREAQEKISRLPSPPLKVTDLQEARGEGRVGVGGQAGRGSLEHVDCVTAGSQATVAAASSISSPRFLQQLSAPTPNHSHLQPQNLLTHQSDCIPLSLKTRQLCQVQTLCLAGKALPD